MSGVGRSDSTSCSVNCVAPAKLPAPVRASNAIYLRNERGVLIDPSFLFAYPCAPMDWKSIASETLASLGGREVCVPGAKLHSAVSKEAGVDDREFAKHLGDQGVTFGQFLQSIEDVEVHRLRGTDMMVGFSGASLPPLPTSRSFTARREYPTIRADVYAAFTRISPDPYRYSKAADEFSRDAPDAPDTVSGPLVTRDIVIDQRRRFIETLDDEEQKATLEKSLEWSASPLGSFSRAVYQCRLNSRWGEFKYNDLRQMVLKWAEERDVTASPDWFSQRSNAPSTGTPQQILAEIASLLTDDEIRELTIPFRVIEEVYRASARRR